MMTSSVDQKPDSDERQPQERLRRLNARWPWLKFAVFLLLGCLVVTGVTMLHQHHDLPENYTEGRQYSELMLRPPARLETMNLADKKLVALTFDDGPSSLTTPRLLDILAEKRVRATFFVVGSMAGRSPAVLQREKSEGHEIGSHSTGHQNLTKLSVADLLVNRQEMENLFQAQLGQPVQLMRPPYGALNQAVYNTMAYPLILWSVDPEDWRYRDAEVVRRAVVGATFDGAIILMHDIYGTTVDAVAGIIDDLRAQGYEFLTVSELAKVRGVQLLAGYKYGSFRP